MKNLINTGRKAIDNLAEGLQARTGDVTSEVLAYELAEADEATALCQHGILLSRADQFERLINAREKYGTDLQGFKHAENQQAEKWLRHYEDWKDIDNYRERRKILEDVIRLLQEDKPDEERAILLAKAYLYRSMLFRPKGYTTPARKIEALKEAKELIDGILKKDGDNPAALKIWSQTALELEKLKEFFFEKNNMLILEKAADLIKKRKPEDIDDFSILIRHAEINDDKTGLDLILNNEFQWIALADLRLFQARAGFMKGVESEKVKSLADEAVKESPGAFSDPFWDDLVTFLIELWNKEWGIWKPLSLSAWKKCMTREKKIASNVVLHWHWNQRKPLYDLAFLAADTPEQKAKIADSLKSRPALRYAALNNLKDQENVREILETEDAARDRRYLKKLSVSDIKTQKEIRKEIKKQTLPMNSLPESWVAVHFYLNDLEYGISGVKGGYAVFFEKNRPAWIESFDYQELYQKFLYWQDMFVTEFTEDTEESRERAAEAMIDLCKNIGKRMPFLFEQSLENKSFLFVPHGFLHRLPLHAAVEQGSNKIFLNNHKTRYLPAWHLISSLSEKSDKINKKSWHLFNNKDDDDYEYEFDYDWNKISDTDIKSLLKGNPSVLTVLCSGRCNILNPFKSSLLLKPEVTILDLLNFETEVKGTCALLGTCESDMSPLTEHAVDEHLSLSSVLLIRGAKETVAGLWLLYPSDIESCYDSLFEKIKNNKYPEALPEALNEWQTDRLEEDPFDDPTFFYYTIPFRIMGFPEALLETDKEAAE